MTPALEGVPEVEIFALDGVSLEFVRTSAGPFVSIGSISRAFGLDDRAQRRRIESRSWARPRVVAARGRVLGARARRLVCIHADVVPMFLATVDASRVASSVRPRLVDFQARCAVVLREFFYGAPRVGVDPARVSRTEALELALAASRERDALEARVLALEPKAAVAERIASSEGFHSVGEVAKAVGTGPNRFFKFLRAERFLLSDGLPFQAHVDAGRAVVREFLFADASGKTRTSRRTLLTGKGLAYVTALWAARGADSAAFASGEEAAP